MFFAKCTSIWRVWINLNLVKSSRDDLNQKKVEFERFFHKSIIPLVSNESQFEFNPRRNKRLNEQAKNPHNFLLSIYDAVKIRRLFCLINNEDVTWCSMYKHKRLTMEKCCLFVCHISETQRGGRARERRPIYSEFSAGIKIIRNSRFTDSTGLHISCLVAGLSTFWFLKINHRDGLQKLFTQRNETAVKRQNKTSMIFSSFVSRLSTCCDLRLFVMFSCDTRRWCIRIVCFLSKIVWEPLANQKEIPNVHILIHSNSLDLTMMHRRLMPKTQWRR